MTNPFPPDMVEMKIYVEFRSLIDAERFHFAESLAIEISQILARKGAPVNLIPMDGKIFAKRRDTPDDCFYIRYE